jgi:Domain of unknown function (DUF4397)
MHKTIWTTLFIVGLSAVLLVAKALGAFTHTQIRMGNAVVALSNSAQDVGAIDVYIDHNLVKANLAATDPTVYMELAPGDHVVDVFPAGGNVVLVKTTDLDFKRDHTYHLTLTGLDADWSVALAVADETTR